MTYDELASLFECELATARDIIIKMNLDLRKSRDGHTRVKLDATLNALFLDKLFAHWVNCKLRAGQGGQRQAPTAAEDKRRQAESWP